MDDPTLAALVREVAKRELGEDDETREQALGLFRDWVVKNPDIRNCRTDDNFLLGFLRAKKFSVNQAEQFLLLLLERIQSIPKLTRNLDIQDPDIDVLYSTGCMYVCPVRDAQGRSISVCAHAKVKPSESSYVDYSRFVFTTLFSMMNDPASQVLGYVHINDFADIETAHVTFFPPMELINFIKITEKALPLRHKEIHIINLNSAAKILFNIIFRTFSKKMLGRIFIHDTLEDLHKKVSPELLPKEYGGNMSAMEMNELWKQRMVKSRELIRGMSDMRLVQDNGGDLIETGSFRKLAID